MLKRAFKYELKPTERQRRFFCQTFGCSRFVYNTMLDKKISAYQSDKTSLSYNDLSAELTTLKSEKTFLKDVPSQALQQSLKDLDSAYKRFFKEKKGFPKFHKKGQKQSFRIPVGCDVDFENWKVKVAKVGLVKIYRGHSRKFENVVKVCSYTISKTTTGRFFISILCDVEDTKPKQTEYNKNKAVGIDLGIKDFAVLSDGQVFENQKYLKHNLKKLKVLQRKMSRRYQRGKKITEQSKNWFKTKLQVAKLHEKIKFQRTDFLQKLSTNISRMYDTVCVESLNVKGMLKNRHLAQAISDCGWGTFISLLKQKCFRLVKIDKWFPSSQTCSCCGYKNDKVKSLSVREWICSQCGTHHDRDFNASKNILREGLSLCGLNLGGRTVDVPKESLVL